VDVHGLGRVADVKMHVDIYVELVPKRKNALDLAGI
jgi:hypothetical protein